MDVRHPDGHVFRVDRGLEEEEELSEPNVEFARLQTIEAYLGFRVRVGLTGLCTKAASDNRIQNRERLIENPEVIPDSVRAGFLAKRAERSSNSTHIDCFLATRRHAHAWTAIAAVCSRTTNDSKDH